MTKEDTQEYIGNGLFIDWELNAVVLEQRGNKVYLQPSQIIKIRDYVQERIADE